MPEKRDLARRWMVEATRSTRKVQGHMGYKEENKSSKEGRRHYRIHIHIEHGTILR
jgi:hypothetical protein